MSGQMKNYDKYLKSLEKMKEPVVPRAKLDMRGAIQFAKKQGIPVGELARADKDKFIQYF